MSDEIPLGKYGFGRAVGQIPTKEVRIVDDTKNQLIGGVPAQQNTGPHQFHPANTKSVSVPDLKELGMDDLATDALLASQERRRKKIEHRTWEALFEVAEASENKTLDASGSGRFTDTLMDGCQKLHKQGGEPENAFLFMNGKTKGYVDEWMEDEIRYNTPTEDSMASTSIRVGGVSFQVLISEHPDADQIVMVSDEMHSAPETVPCVVINNPPIGVEIRIEVDGEDNNIVVN